MNLIKPQTTIFSAVFLLVCSTPCFALSSDATFPYHFRSDSIIYNKNKHRTTYLGHVHITQGTMRMSGTKVVIQYSKNSHIEKIIDTGNLAHYSTLPNHQRAYLYAEAKKITFNPTTKIVLMEKKGKVTQKKKCLQRASYLV